MIEAFGTAGGDCACFAGTSRNASIVLLAAVSRCLAIARCPVRVGGCSLVYVVAPSLPAAYRWVGDAPVRVSRGFLFHVCRTVWSGDRDGVQLMSGNIGARRE